MLLGGTAALVAATSPAASAASDAPSAAPAAWIRIAHLSPKAPAMDMYLYPFGEPGHPIVLRDVGYGEVSAYLKVSPGQYSVAMRGFGAPPSSPPALITSFMVSTGAPYTVAALGPDPGLRVEVLKDQVSAPAGRALVRVVQASLKEHQVTVSYGPEVLGRQLTFGVATSYRAVAPGARTVRFAASGGHASTSVTMAADTVHTIVVLDDSSGLRVDALLDAAGSQIMPKGGAEAGFGGTAARAAGNPAPWLLVIAMGALLAAVGLAGLTRPRRPGLVPGS
jgi:hypothetical protein